MEKNNGNTKKFFSRLIFEGVIKSLICGGVVAFAASFIASFVAFWLIRNGLVPALIAGVVSLAIAVPLFYFYKFRPSIKNVAHRVDRLGLEERFITMLDLKDDDSIFAQKQREDAEQHISRTYQSSTKLPLRIFVMPIIIMAALLVISASMTTISVLSEQNKIPWSPNRIANPNQEYTLEYLAGEGGYISGADIQQVYTGENGERVVAIAYEGYVFVGWSDELERAERQDVQVGENIVVTARFDVFSDNNDGGETKEPSEKGDQQKIPEDLELKKDGEQNEERNDDSEGGKFAGGKYDPRNYILDGSTYYRTHYQDYFDRMLELIESGEDIPEEVKEMIRNYYDIIV